MPNWNKIYSSRCWINDQLVPATIQIEQNKIISVKEDKDGDAMDFRNAVIMPGGIDAHVHINEPGRTDWEGFETATLAAAAGGITSIIDMPLNSSPVTTSAQALQRKLEASTGKLNVNVGFYGGIIPGNEPAIEELCEQGVLGIKAFLTHSGIDEFPNVEKEELEIVMPVLKKYDRPLLAHCEISDEKHQAALHQHPSSYKAYLQSRPGEWEVKAINLMLELCARHHCKTHIVHVSSAHALPLIEKAKQAGLPLTAETCPHYIYFSAEEIKDGETLLKCAPPIRSKENNEQLKSAFQNGILNFIASDHSPAPPQLKALDSGNFEKAWGGIAGLQFLLSATYTALSGTLPLEKIIPLLTTQPAKFLGLEQKGKLAPGMDADLVIWMPEESYIVEEDNILHRHKTTPYLGRRLKGKVEATIVNGKRVFHQNKFINKNAGTWLMKK